MLKVRAPAKINLALEVLGKRPDGFHEIRSVMHTIDLADSLSFSPSDKIEISSDNPRFDPEKSLVARAVALFRQVSGSTDGVRIEIEKRIPFSAGLGGDSSDAAAVLRGLNRFWPSGLKQAQLLGLAPSLGSDVSFFLYGGAAMVEGRGEKVSPLPSLPRRWVVLVVPPIEMEEKTRQLYARLQPNHYSEGDITDLMVMGLTRGVVKPYMLFNTFENVAYDFFPKLVVYKGHLLKMGAPFVRLAGSGPTLFTMLEDKAQAEDLYQRCRDQKMECYLASTLSSLDSL